MCVVLYPISTVDLAWFMEDNILPGGHCDMCRLFIHVRLPIRGHRAFILVGGGGGGCIKLNYLGFGQQD